MRATLRDTRLPSQTFTAFPFRIAQGGVHQTSRLGHIRDSVEQVLFTSPGERVFRPEWGFGARQFVFEPNQVAIWETVQNRLTAALAETLAASHPAAMAEMKQIFWAGTDHWDDLLAERAAVSGRLVLAEEAQSRIRGFLGK